MKSIPNSAARPSLSSEYQCARFQGLLTSQRNETTIRSFKARAGTTAGFKNFGDGLLDYMEAVKVSATAAGPKLRKWYGKGEQTSPDGPEPEPDEEKLDGPADSVLVTDADSRTGELVLLQLILARLKVTALVRDAAAAQQAYGAYIRPVQGDVGDENAVLKALASAKALICPGAVGLLPKALKRSQVRHAVLLSTVGASTPGLLQRVLGSEEGRLADPKREDLLKATGVPVTLVRVGKLKDAPGGASELRFSQHAVAGSNETCREDVAQVLVRALENPPHKEMTFAVQSANTGQPTDWGQLFASLQEAAAI